MVFDPAHSAIKLAIATNEYIEGGDGNGDGDDTTTFTARQAGRQVVGKQIGKDKRFQSMNLACFVMLAL